MASGTRRGRGRDTQDTGDDRKRFALAGALLAVVLVVLVLAALLQRGAGEGAADAAPGARVTIEGGAEGPAAEPPLPGPWEPPPSSSPEPLPAGGGPEPGTATPAATPRPADLVARARRDSRRLHDHRDGFTLQLLVACDPHNAALRIAEAGDADGLHVLPVDLEGRACYRLCWGAYPSREAALDAPDLPGKLRESLGGGAQPRRIGDLLP